eukprot:TRINITY_DN8186_c0_g1_i1.p1 TRINITY_DN8186_c0_g1~~TRINITY_DN8186_c0_g1_i1.p1  ORF type:complete len:135 (-),score=24.50 TRINITY_DN8186_c0_g1_i1:53-457(-)
MTSPTSLKMSFLLLTVLHHVHPYVPIYLGRFKQTSHRVGGDVFVLDEETIYIQDFSHDGQVRDVFFSIDGDIIPYITRSNLEPQLRVKRFSPSEDVILLLPPDKSSIFNIDKLVVKCRTCRTYFGLLKFPTFIQ